MPVRVSVCLFTCDCVFTLSVLICFFCDRVYFYDIRKCVYLSHLYNWLAPILHCNHARFNLIKIPLTKSSCFCQRSFIYWRRIFLKSASCCICFFSCFFFLGFKYTRPSICLSVCQELLFQERLEISSWNSNSIQTKIYGQNFLKISYFYVCLKKNTSVYITKNVYFDTNRDSN